MQRVSMFFIFLMTSFFVVYPQTDTGAQPQNGVTSGAEGSTGSAAAKEMSSSAEMTPSAEPADSTGSLRVITIPAGAAVDFDDKTLGQSPLTIVNIAFGKHTILIRMKGYFAKKAAITIATSGANEVTFELIKPVRLSVTSEPAGASVFVNMQKAGETPFADDKLKPGSFNLLVRKEGYQQQHLKAELGSGETDSMHVVLVPAAKTTKSQPAQSEKKETKDDKSRLTSILDKVALGIFLCFTVIIFIIELSQKE